MNIQDKPFLPIGGLSTDTEPVNQPDGTTRFALNALYDAESGAQGSINNEHSNQICVDLDGKIIGTINADRVNLVVFTSNNSIYLVDTSICEATKIITNQEFAFGDIITGTYRVIKGCERVIYWRDGINPDRQLNIDKLDDYQEVNDFSVTPEFYPANVELEVQESGGALEYGTYFFVLQYTDSQGNVAAKSIPYGPVYITGGLNIENYLPDVGGLPLSNKSIRLNITNIDTRYDAIKLAVIKYTSSDGVTPNAHEVGNIIEITSDTIRYTYSGFNANNGDTLTTQSSLIIPGVYYESSKVMRQVQGRLLRGNLLEKSVDYGVFQQYASKIKSEFITTDVSIDDSYKDIVKTEIGDEVKAYGIVYVFDTGQISPVFHIPGNYIVSPNDINSTYINPTNYCKDDFWGTDANGNSLLNTSVRHHKVPSRSQIPIMTAERIPVTVQADRYQQLVPCSDDPVVLYTERKPTVRYERVNIADSQALQQVGVSPNVSWRYNGQTTNIDNPGIIVTSVQGSGYSNCTGTDKIPLPPEGYGTTYVDGDMALRYIGIKFDNIEYPANSGIIGHYFVTNIRNEGTKNVLQTGIATPLNSGQEYPLGLYTNTNAQDFLFANGPNVASKYQNIISPDFLFEGSAPKGDYIQYYGTFSYTDKRVISFGKERKYITSVRPGDFTQLSVNDSKYNEVTYAGNHYYLSNYESKFATAFGTENAYSISQKSEFNDIQNKSHSNKFYIVELDRVLNEDTGWYTPNTANFNYVAIKSTTPILTNLNTITYRLTDNVLYQENESASIFAGDAYLTPMSLVNIASALAGQKAYLIAYEWLNNLYVESEINPLWKFGGTTECNEIIDYKSEHTELVSKYGKDYYLPTSKYINGILSSKDNDILSDNLRLLRNHLLNSIATVTNYGLQEYQTRPEICYEFYGYNKDWKILSSTRLFRALGYYYDYCSNCSNKYPNRIIWSEVSREEDLQDNYRIFKPLSYFDIPADKGAITSFDYIDNVILVRTEQSSFILQPNPQQIQASGTTISLGTGDFLSLPAQELISVPTGHGGQQDVLAEVNTKFGLVWVDKNEGKAFLKPTGGGFEEISSYKMYHWFERNLPGGEVICTYDPRFERLILHKKQIDIENKGFTISYNFRTKSWISFHSYQPQRMTYTNNTFFTTLGTGLYSHNNYNSFTTYYSIAFPFAIEAIDTNFNTFNPHSIFYYAQVQYFDLENSEWIPVEMSFDQMIAYNKTQSTGLVELEVKDQLRALNWDNKTKPVSIKDKNSRISQIRDIAIGQPVMTSNWNLRQSYYVNNQGYIDKVPFDTNIDYNKQQIELNEFSDKYVHIRFFFNKNTHKVTIHLMDVNKFASLR